MVTTINVNAVAVKDAEGKTTYERSIDFPILKILETETLKEMAETLGEDYIVHQTKAQIKIQWRSRMRAMMEKRDDNGEYEYTDEALIEAHDVNWIPELRVNKTPEEKALEALGALDPATRAAVLAQIKKTKE